jgi:hypothetical protein
MTEYDNVIVEQELKQLQLSRAKIEFKIKEQELQRMRDFWRSILTNPITLIAVITVFATIAIIVKFELDKSKFEAQLVVDAMRTSDQAQSVNNIQFLLNSGLLSDPNNNVSKALEIWKSELQPEGPEKTEEPEKPELQSPFPTFRPPTPK